MLMTEEMAAVLEAHPDMRKRFQAWPLAYFGHIVSYPKQAEIIRTWLDKRPKVTVITGWQRTGKTQCASYIGSAWLMGELNKHWPGAKAMQIPFTYQWVRKINGHRVGMIGGKSMDHVENVLLEQYRQLLPPGMVKRWFSRGKHSLELHTGQKFIIRTYDQDLEQWKSASAQFVHLDEEPPLGVMREVLERSRTTKGRILITVAIDDADVSWLPEACEKPEKFFGTNDFLHFKMGVEDVPTDIYPQEEKDNVYRLYDKTPLRNAVRYGDFVYLSGRWWPEFCDVHIIPPFPIKAHWPKYRFIDAGVAAPSACAWVAIHPMGFLIVYREYYKAGTTINERCRDIIELSGNTRRRDGGIWIEEQRNERYEITQLDHAEFKMDQITGGGVDYEYLASGIPVIPWTTLGQEARREIVRKFLTLDPKRKHFVTHELGMPRMYVFEDCTNLIWEARHKCFKRDKSDNGSVPEKKVQNRDDHLMDCVEGAAIELRWMVDNQEVYDKVRE